MQYRDDVTPTGPLEDRTYTMTHSDTTGDLFVTIGLNYAVDQTNAIQDQVYMKWMPMGNKNCLYGEVLVDGKEIPGSAEKRYTLFKQEMPLALQAIYVADIPLFEAYPELKETPVLIDFDSTLPEYDKLYSYGYIGDYAIDYIQE